MNKEDKEINEVLRWFSSLFIVIGFLISPGWVKFLMIAYFFRPIRDE